MVPKLSIRLEFAEGEDVGPFQVRLLEEVERQRSITAAGRAVGISYTKAWRLLAKLNGYSGGPVVEATAGGPVGGSATLTSRGRMLVQLYRSIEQDAQAVGQPAIDAAERRSKSRHRSSSTT
jgi:molybdate transport system regulatory protein